MHPRRTRVSVADAELELRTADATPTSPHGEAFLTEPSAVTSRAEAAAQRNTSIQYRQRRCPVTSNLPTPDPQLAAAAETASATARAAAGQASELLDALAAGRTSIATAAAASAEAAAAADEAWAANEAARASSEARKRAGSRPS